MRLGAPVFGKWDDPRAWAAAVKAEGYRSTFCPIPVGVDNATADAYARAAKDADILIAEVGAWGNTLSNDPAERSAALEKAKRGLELAERLGAPCCVNVAGSRGPCWRGPFAADLTEETFQMVVETARTVIDAVRPTKTCYSFEPMPWMLPDSPDSYLELIRAIDRPAFGVHLDPVNMINSPRRYFENGLFIEECFAKLGPYIKGVHAKDVIIGDEMPIHLNETRPGLGTFDFGTFLREMNKLDPETPVLIEHLKDAEEYRAAAEHIRSVARQEGIAL